MKLIKVKCADSFATKRIADKLNANIDKFDGLVRKSINDLIYFCQRNDEAKVREYFRDKLSSFAKKAMQDKTPFIFELLKTL